MNRNFFFFWNSVRTLFLGFLAVIAALPALAQQDTTPPVLTGFTFSPMAVDTTTSPATVNLTAQITDDLSGVSESYMYFLSPSEHQYQSGGMSLTSGNNLNGTWTGTATLPAHSEAGTWTVEYVLVFDNAGNTHYYYTSDLQALGFSTTLQVTSIQDTTPPVLTGFTFSPMAVDTTTSPAAVNLTAQITDDLSGVSESYMYFLSPSEHQNQSGGMSLTSGNNLNGTWTGTATLPAHSEAGTWTVEYVLVVDNAGNAHYYYPSDLQALGFSTTLQVTSIQDTTPPVLTGFTFSPMAVDTTTSPATVNLTAQITDDLSGVSESYMYFLSPSEHQYQSGGMSLTSGNNLNGTWTGTATLPAHSEAGTWTVEYVLVFDNAGNTHYYYTSDLQALGFSTQLMVDVASTTTKVTSSSNPSVLGQPVTFTATVTPQGPGTPTGTVTFSDGSTALGTSPLSGAMATLSTSALTVGPHTINAVYSGDSNFIGSSASLNQLIITPPPYNAFVQQPINSDGSSIFNAKRGVVPAKFTLTQNGMQTCALPAATISVTRTAGGTPGAIDEASYVSPADNGSNFRIDATACQYVYNLAAQSLGVGTYRVDININGSVVGSAVFALK